MSGKLGKPFESALVYATRLHASQTRKGTDVPYVAHLLAVASLVIEAGGTEDEAIAALLHDGPEDQGGLETLAQIRELFGERVADIVAACSDTFEEKKPAWKQRKQAYLDHLLDANASTRLISCADKLHNARAILADYRRVGDVLWDRFNAGRGEILWYYGELARIFTGRGPEVLAGQLAWVVEQLRAEAGQQLTERGQGSLRQRRKDGHLCRRRVGYCGRPGSDPATTAIEWLPAIGQEFRLNGGFLIPHRAVVDTEQSFRGR